MMVDRPAVFARLARLAAAGDPLQQWVARLCEASRILVGARGGSVSINNDGSDRMTVAFTDDVAAQLENLQDVLAEGPCREAHRQNAPVEADLRNGDGDPWPEFIRSAREIAGEVIVRCFPMRPTGDPVGVFTIYAADGELTEPVEVVQFVADAMGAAVLNDPSPYDPAGVWSVQSVIHQATGMLVAQLQVQPDDALAVLQAHAFAHGATVGDVAVQIVRRRLDFREDR